MFSVSANACVRMFCIIIFYNAFIMTQKHIGLCVNQQPPPLRSPARNTQIIAKSTTCQPSPTGRRAIAAMRGSGGTGHPASANAEIALEKPKTEGKKSVSSHDRRHVNIAWRPPSTRTSRRPRPPVSFQLQPVKCDICPAYT